MKNHTQNVVRKLQSWPKYMRQTLVLVWNSTLKEDFNFWTVVCYYWQDFHFGRKTGTMLYYMKIWDLLTISWFPKILSLKSFCNLWGNYYTPCLLLITAICFTCGVSKIWENIKKSRNIMVKIAENFISWNLYFFCFLGLEWKFLKCIFRNIFFQNQFWEKFLKYIF